MAAVTGLQTVVDAIRGDISSLNTNKVEKLTDAGTFAYSHNGSTQGSVPISGTYSTANDGDLVTKSAIATAISSAVASKLDANLGSVNDGKWLAIDSAGDIVAVGAPNTSEFRGPYASTGALPATGDSNDMYLVGASAPYKIYAWIGSAYVETGSTDVSLEGYVQSSDTAGTHVYSHTGGTDGEIAVATDLTTGTSIPFASAVSTALAAKADATALANAVSDIEDKVDKLETAGLRAYTHNTATQGDIAIETTLTNSSTSLPTSSAVYSAIGILSSVSYESVTV